MISLNRKEIEALIDFDCAAAAIEAAYRAISDGRVNLPPVGYIAFSAFQGSGPANTPSGDCHIKYGHIAGDPNFVVKVATGFAGNDALGIPSGNGIVLVLSAQTGAVKAVLHDEMVMTDIRTGLGGAIASRQLAREGAKNILIVGTGVQARRQIEAHIALMGPELLFSLWGRSAEKAKAVIASLSSVAPILLADDLAAACRSADIIITTTAAAEPIIKRSWITPGTHITAVGADAPGKQELESALVVSADVLCCDLKSQCLDHGDYANSFSRGGIDENLVVEIGDVLSGRALGRTTKMQVTICDLTGLAVQDIAMANSVLDAFDRS